MELFSGTTFSPLNVGSSIDCPSLKSFSQPTLGQTSGALAGTLQNFVYMMSCVTFWKLTSKPISSSWLLNTSAVSDPGGESSPTMVISHSEPSHLPLDIPAFLKYAAETSGSPLGLAR